MLQDAGLPLRHKVRLAPGVRINFDTGGVGIEIKTAGAGWTPYQEAAAPLRRHGMVSAILLITTSWDHLRRADCARGFDVPVAVLHIRARRDQACNPRFRSFG